MGLILRNGTVGDGDGLHGPCGFGPGGGGPRMLGSDMGHAARLAAMIAAASHTMRSARLAASA